MAATYTKLRDESWGVRVVGPAQPGPIEVTKKSGETKTETIVAVVWSGNGVSLCQIAGRDGNPAQPHCPKHPKVNLRRSSYGRGSYCPACYAERKKREEAHGSTGTCWECGGPIYGRGDGDGTCGRC